MDERRRIYMSKKIDRIWKYFKCPKCGKDGLSHFINGVTECECKTKIYYDETIENQWLNEINDKGERVRLDFEGSNEQECRMQAATYFNCEKSDINNYYIVQKAGLFKKFIINATRPITFEDDPDAVKVVMWEYEGKPKIWLDINTKRKTILYPNELGNDKIEYKAIKGLEYDTKSTLSGVKYNLNLDPQGEVALYFYPGYENNFNIFLDAVKSELNPINHGMFVEEFFDMKDFNPHGIANHENANMQIQSNDFYYSGYLFVWKTESELCFCNSKTRIGYKFPLENIKYYRLLGQKYVTTEISGGGGGGSSIRGALIGGLVAGEVGATIGSRKAVNEVKGTSTIHDEQKVLLYGNDLKQVLEFSSSAYAVFTKLIPEKEYEIVMQSEGKTVNCTTSSENSIDAIEKLAGLYEKGILTKEEFERKKTDLLNRI